MTNLYLETLSDFTNEPLKRKLLDQPLGTLLITPDLAESNGPRAKPMAACYICTSERVLGGLRFDLNSFSAILHTSHSCAGEARLLYWKQDQPYSQTRRQTI